MARYPFDGAQSERFANAHPHWRTLSSASKQRAQRNAETEHMRRRLGKTDIELEREPEQIETLYSVALKRFTPVGLVVLWPTTR